MERLTEVSQESNPERHKMCAVSPILTLLTLLLFLPPFAICASAAAPNLLTEQRVQCAQRCHRLLQRSLERGGGPAADELVQRIATLRRERLLLSEGTTAATSAENDGQFPADFKTICWKFFDFEDCSRQCEKAFLRRRKKSAPMKKRALMGQEHRQVLHFCHQSLSEFGVPQEQFECIHKYHAFMEVRCSGYQQKAVQLRLLALQLRQPDLDLEQLGGVAELQALQQAVEQDVCLLLHQHSACLANALAKHCPHTNRALFQRPSLREHFLSFVLPFGRATDQQGKEAPIELDSLLSDALLDQCQLMDLQRMEWTTTPSSRESGPQGTEQQQRSTTTKRALDREWTRSPAEEDEGELITVPSERRKVFSSEEDLLDTPPNFHYSTARLPSDFYTRYAVWWGGRRRNQPKQPSSPLVQLLPVEPVVRSQQKSTTQWPQRPPTPLLVETRPDTLPTSTVRTPATHEWEMTQEQGVTLPYRVNGQVTTPRERWQEEVTTEIRLMPNEWHAMSEAERRAAAQEQAAWTRSWTREPAEPSAESSIEQQRMSTTSNQESERYSLSSVENIIQHIDVDQQQQSNPPPFVSTTAVPSSLEVVLAEMEQNRRIEAPSAEEPRPTPMLRDTTVYFAKILQFGQEDESAEERNEFRPMPPVPEEAAVVAQMVHFPREQLPHRRREEQKDRSVAAELDTEEDEGGDLQNSVYSEDDYEVGEEEPLDDDEAYGTWRAPFEIHTADPDEFLRSGAAMADLSHKTRAPFHPSHFASTTTPPKIRVSAEPVPDQHSETLFVLVGVYLTFFAVSAFLLLCLVLACVERKRRRATLLRGGGSRRTKSVGSAILYMDEKKGTVKRVV